MALEGGRLFDGGISEMVPVRRAREMVGEGGVVAVDCNNGARWPAADSFASLALRAGLTMLRGRTRGELAGADFVIAPSMGESGWADQDPKLRRRRRGGPPRGPPRAAAAHRLIPFPRFRSPATTRLT
jgi:predicted acylesterase/phospholipase RssA